MAKNKVFANGRQLSLVCSDPATPSSGDPVVVGQIPGVALTDERADGTTTVDMEGVFDLSVKGQEWNGTALANIAVGAGDKLYYTAGRTPVLDRDNRGVYFGYALEAVAAGATTTIRVKVGY
jgi:predicted RecA/RadA family phage recombinase